MAAGETYSRFSQTRLSEVQAFSLLERHMNLVYLS